MMMMIIIIIIMHGKKGRGTHRDWSEKPREKDHLEDLDTDGRIVEIIIIISKKQPREAT
jgi:hypothetical protein